MPKSFKYYLKTIYIPVIIILTIPSNVFSQKLDSLTSNRNGYERDSVNNFAKNNIYCTIVKETGYGLLFGTGATIITGGLIYFGMGSEAGLISYPLIYLGYSLGATYGILTASREDGNNPNRWLTFTSSTIGVVSYTVFLLKQPGNFVKGKAFLINSLLIPILVPVLYIHFLDKMIFPNNYKENRISKYKFSAIEYENKFYLNIIIDL